MRERDANQGAVESESDREHRLAANLEKERLTFVRVRQMMKGSVDWPR